MRALKTKAFSTLRWSEKYFNTDMVYLAQGGFWLTLSQLVSSATSFLLIVVLANLISQETLGEYRFFMSGLLLLSGITLPGMSTAILESTPKGFKRNLEVASHQTMRWGFFIGSISLILSIYYFFNKTTSLGIGFLLISILLSLYTSKQIFFGYLKSLREFKLFAQYTIITRLVIVTSMLAGAYLFPKHAWVLILVFLLSNIVPNYLMQITVQRKFVRTEDVSDPSIQNYAKHLSFLAMIGIVASQIDSLFIWNFIGPKELAIFFIANTIPQEILRFLGVMTSLSFPKLAVLNHDTAKTNLFKKTFKYLVIIITLGLLSVVLMPYFFKYIFPQYMDSIIYGQILMLTIIPAAFEPISTYFLVKKKKSEIKIISTIIPIFHIVISLILVKLFGIWGAIATLLLDAALRVFLLTLLFKKMD